MSKLARIAFTLSMLSSLTLGCSETASRTADAGATDVGHQPGDGPARGDGGGADAVAGDGGSVGGFPSDEEINLWTHGSVNSALIYWLAGAIEVEATSHVEYGESDGYGEQTAATAESRWAQLHRLTGLKAGTTYHFRMVQTADGVRQVSADHSFTTGELAGAIQVPGDLPGPPYVLSQDDARYVLTQDITAGANGIEVTGSDTTVDLNGHSLTYGDQSGEQCFGVIVKSPGKVILGNGHVIQGAAAGGYSSGVETRWREAPIEIFGITTEVHRPNGFPLRLFGSAADAELHHNHLSSRVMELESRHYPGNALMQVDASGPGVKIHHNLLTEGLHRGISVSGDGLGAEVSENDIRHHARYVNGYALACSADGMKVHHNRVTSTGRGVHLKAADLELHHNHLDIKGHMTLDDQPRGNRPFEERMIELHGIKFEETLVKRAKVHDNYMRIIQRLPDAEWEYVPATPLNIACYDPDAGNEVYGNTFVALTEYSETRHGGYGDSGQWASAIYLVGMDRGPAAAGGYTIYVHDNTFISNDLFVSGNTEVNMTVRIEDNTFTLATDPPPTASHAPFRNIGESLESAIKAGGNTFQGMTP